jgi:hypothetical protein
MAADKSDEELLQAFKAGSRTSAAVQREKR